MYSIPRKSIIYDILKKNKEKCSQNRLRNSTANREDSTYVGKIQSKQQVGKRNEAVPPISHQNNLNIPSNSSDISNRGSLLRLVTNERYGSLFYNIPNETPNQKVTNISKLWKDKTKSAVSNPKTDSLLSASSYSYNSQGSTAFGAEMQSTINLPKINDPTVNSTEDVNAEDFSMGQSHFKYDDIPRFSSLLTNNVDETTNSDFEVDSMMSCHSDSCSSYKTALSDFQHLNMPDRNINDLQTDSQTKAKHQNISIPEVVKRLEFKEIEKVKPQEKYFGVTSLKDIQQYAASTSQNSCFIYPKDYNEISDNLESMINADFKTYHKNMDIQPSSYKGNTNRKRDMSFVEEWCKTQSVDTTLFQKPPMESKGQELTKSNKLGINKQPGFLQAPPPDFPLPEFGPQKFQRTCFGFESSTKCTDNISKNLNSKNASVSSFNEKKTFEKENHILGGKTKPTNVELESKMLYNQTKMEPRTLRIENVPMQKKEDKSFSLIDETAPSNIQNDELYAKPMRRIGRRPKKRKRSQIKIKSNNTSKVDDIKIIPPPVLTTVVSEQNIKNNTNAKPLILSRPLRCANFETDASTYSIVNNEIPTNVCSSNSATDCDANSTSGEAKKDFISQNVNLTEVSSIQNYDNTPNSFPFFPAKMGENCNVMKSKDSIKRYPRRKDNVKRVFGVINPRRFTVPFLPANSNANSVIQKNAETCVNELSLQNETIKSDSWNTTVEEIPQRLAKLKALSTLKKMRYKRRNNKRCLN